MTNELMGDRGERFALHDFGKAAIVPGASAAAHAVFLACGGAMGWKSWILPSGKMIRTSLELMAQLLDDDPNAPAEALYAQVMAFPGHSPKAVPWAKAPMQVKGAYEAFRAVYLNLWALVRTHSEDMARSLPARPLPQLVGAGDVVVRFPRPAAAKLEPTGDEVA